VQLVDLARVLATTEDHPRHRSRVLYLSDDGGGPEPAGFADAVGDVVTVLDRLDTEGADGLAVQTRVGAPQAGADEPVDRPAAVVALRDGGFAMAVGAGHGRPTVASDHAPRPDDAPALQLCWRFVVHAMAALDAADAIPEPPDDPHPAAYLMAAWLRTVLQAAKVDAEVLDRIRVLPDEAGLVAALGLPVDASGWDAVREAAAVRAPEVAERLGRNGTAWEAHVLLGDPGVHLAAVAESGRVELADRLFADLTERGWARAAGTP
jgi:hypothetical protein